MFKYSVIIPHYRDEKFMPKLIRSIPQRDDIQIIVVDDNSYETHDAVSEMIGQIGREGLELYFNDKSKRGAGGCRNIGLSHAKGQWLLFADSDDYFTEDAFSVFDDASKDSDVDMFFFCPTSVNLPEGNRGTRHLLFAGQVKSFVSKPTKTTEEELRYNFLVPWSRMVRRQLVTDNEITFEDIRWSNDVMFAAKCGFYAKKIKAIDSVVYCATRQTGSLTTTKNAQIFKVRFDAYIRKYVFVRENGGKALARRVMSCPMLKLALAKLDKYDGSVTKDMIKSFRENHISLLTISLRDVWRGFMKLRMYKGDKKYSGKYER